MTGTFNTDNGMTTVNFEYVATTEKVLTSVEDAVHYLYPNTFGKILEDGVVIPFEELTNQQKLDVLDVWLKKTVLDLAKQYDRQRILEEAKAAAAEEADKYF